MDITLTFTDEQWKLILDHYRHFQTEEDGSQTRIPITEEALIAVFKTFLKANLEIFMSEDAVEAAKAALPVVDV